MANQTVGLCIGVSTAIVVDMGICLQGNEEDELPEVAKYVHAPVIRYHACKTSLSEHIVHIVN